MRAAWLLVPLSLAGCGIVVGLGDPLPVRGDDAGADAMDSAVDTGVLADGAGDTSAAPDVSDTAEAPVVTAPANVLFVDVAGRIALGRVDTAGSKLKLLDAIEAGYTEATKVGTDAVVLLDPTKHQKRTITFDKGAWTGVLSKAIAVPAAYDHVTAVGPDLVAWISSGTGAYRVERLTGDPWELVNEGTVPAFVGLTLFAYSETKMLRFWNDTGTAWAGRWFGGAFKGFVSSGGTYGWSHLVAVGGPTFFVYSSILSAGTPGSGGLEQVKLGPSEEILAPTAASFGPTEFPWTDWQWTGLARAGTNVAFYKGTTGNTRLLRFTVDTSLTIHAEEVATDAKPGAGWTKIVGLD